MHILVLGGTQFVGRHIVLEALSRGHTVTTFTRGRTPDDLPEAVERLHGDRDGDLTALEGRNWDAVVDVSGYVPRVVRASAEKLRDGTRRYLFISTISVYEDFARPDVREDDPRGTLSDPTVEAVTGETYGPLKALCEDAVQEVYAQRATIVRPGLIVGPFDHTDRFTFWADHLARDDRFVLFGEAETPAQFIDARDLAAFTLHLLEQDTPGVFNAVGERRTWGDVVQDVRVAAGRVADVTFRDDAALEASGLSLPLAGRRWGDSMQVSDDRAVTAGLTRRPFADTVRDTLSWVGETSRTLNTFGLTDEKRAELLS